MTGYTRKAIRRQLRTPRLRASGGKRRNWNKVEDIAKKVNIAPIRRESIPKPPANLKGRLTFGSSSSCGGWWRKTGINYTKLVKGRQI